LGWLIANSKAGFCEHNGEVLGSVSEKFMFCQAFRNHHIIVKPLCVRILDAWLQVVLNM
jgi:hypothetical protein